MQTLTVHEHHEIEFTEEPASIDAWEVDELDRDSELESVVWARERTDD